MDHEERSTGWQINQLKEYIEELRKNDHNYLEEKFRALDKALLLQAANYPTQRDFLELKTKAEVEFAARAGSTKGILLFFQITSGIGLILGVILTVLKFSE